MGLFLVTIILVLMGCEKSIEQEVSYEKLKQEMSNLPETDLCFWYFNKLASERDEEKYYHFDYSCPPSVDYRGSEIDLQKRFIIKKELVNLKGHFGGCITSGDFQPTKDQ